MGVVALTLRAFSNTVRTGGVVSTVTAVVELVAHMDVAARQTVYKEHLQATRPVIEMQQAHSVCRNVLYSAWVIFANGSKGVVFALAGRHIQRTK